MCISVNTNMNFIECNLGYFLTQFQCSGYIASNVITWFLLMQSTWICKEDSMAWSHLERLKLLKASGSMAATLVENFTEYR